MSERVISILLSAKDATASAFDRAKGGVKDLASDTQKATSGMRAMYEAVARAISGDLVGAAQSAGRAFKNLSDVILKNTFIALIAILAAAALAMYKWTQAQKVAAQAAREHAIEISKLQDSLDNLTLGTYAETVGKAIKQMSSTKDIQAMRDELAEQQKQFKQNAAAAQEYIDKLRAMNKPENKMSQREKYAKEDTEANLAKIEQRMRDNKAAAEAYQKAIEDLAASELKAAEDALAARKKEAEELEKIADKRFADEEATLLDINEARSDALDESTKLAEKQLQEERKIRQAAAAQAVKDAEANAKAAAEAYEKAKAVATESFRRATDEEYRRAQEKKERDEIRAAEKAQREYEKALEKAQKGIRGKHIDEALKAKQDSLKSIQELENKFEAQKKLDAANAAYQKNIADIAKNTADAVTSIDALRGDLTGGGA